MADQLFCEGRRVENSADAGGDGSNGFQFPQVETLVELAPLEFFPQLPRTETEAGGAEGRFVETFEVEQPKAPQSFFGAEGDFAPSFGRLFDL